jgi:Family of unknown function (DUF5947)
VSSRLRELAQRPANAPAAAPEAAPARCELCSAPIAADHRHLLQLADRELLCICRACALLFDRDAASEGRYRLVPDRRLRLDGLELSDVAWEELRLPVDIAFFFHSSAARRVQAFYPSPMGPTESLLPLDAWAGLEAANPILGEMAPDVEALLVHRARGARRQWIVPIDECYALVGLIRTRWRGFTGGADVWEALSRFFDELDRRSRPSGREMTCAR